MSASAAALGCRGTLGEIAYAIDPLPAPITRLACSGDNGQAFSGDQLISLHQFEGDGVWREVGRESSRARPERCLLPIPPVTLLERDLGDLSPVDVTRQVRRQSNLIQVSDRRSRRVADHPQWPCDDSASEVTYVVCYVSSGPAVNVDRAFRITRCSRGVAVDDAGQPLDLCI